MPCARLAVAVYDELGGGRCTCVSSVFSSSMSTAIGKRSSSSAIPRHRTVLGVRRRGRLPGSSCNQQYCECEQQRQIDPLVPVLLRDSPPLADYLSATLARAEGTRPQRRPSRSHCSFSTDRVSIGGGHRDCTLLHFTCLPSSRPPGSTVLSTSSISRRALCDL